MTLVPRSLFGRNVLLLMALFAFGFGAGLLGLRVRALRPRVTEIAVLVARHITLAADALRAPGGLPEARLGLQVLPQKWVTPPAPPPWRARAVRQFEAELRLRLPEALDVRWDSADGGTVWVLWPLGKDKYWLIEKDAHLELLLLPGRTAGYLGFIAVLSVMGAVLIQRRLNRPLTELADAVRMVGTSQPLATLDENGPEELALVSRAFNHMTVSLAKADAERAVLLAGVSHDLRTPLAKMRLAIEMLRESADPELVESMLRSAAEMQGVTDQFLYYAKVHEACDLVPAELNELVQGCVERHREGARFVAFTPAEPCCANIHRESLVRALDNLIENALRYSEGDVEVTVAQGSRCATLSVWDRGPGIPPAEVETLRQPFARGSASVGKSGTGLGLAIVDRIAASHGARLELLPRAGGGTEARLELPLSSGPTGRPASYSPTEANPERLTQAAEAHCSSPAFRNPEAAPRP